MSIDTRIRWGLHTHRPCPACYGKIAGRAELVAENARLQERVKEAEQWVRDLQAGMYINCVYCGHRYGPDDEVPATMADALKEHIEQCPKHPMSALKALTERRKEALPDPDKLRLLADWFDGDDAVKGRAGPTLATLGGQPSDEVQQELRGWARDIDVAIEEEGT